MNFERLVRAVVVQFKQKQCDQISRIFDNLAKFQKSLAIIEC